MPNRSGLRRCAVRCGAVRCGAGCNPAGRRGLRPLHCMWKTLLLNVALAEQLLPVGGGHCYIKCNITPKNKDAFIF